MDTLIMIRFLFLAFLLGATAGCSDGVVEQSEPAPDPLIGVWEVTDIQWIYPDTTYRIEEPQPGFLHFSGHRYSFIWTPTRAPRVPFKVLSQPTPEEMQAGFRSIVLNAGTYEKTADEVRIRAEVAKVPGFEGGTQVFSYELNGDTLGFTMTDETYPDGTKPAWFGKMKTAFELVRID